MNTNKTVLITGTNRGLGKTLLKLFASKNFNVIAHARTKNDNHTKYINQLLNEYNVSIYPCYFDLTNETEMKDQVQQLIKNKIKIYALINSAGIAHGGYFQMTKMKTIRDVFEINFFAQIELTQLLFRWMSKNGGGNIVNIASNAGIDLSAGNCAYGVSKAALIAFTKTLAAEYALTNIRVNAVAPGLTDTDMSTLMDDKSQKLMLNKTTLKRKATTEEIANTVFFLASESSSFVNGQVIRVDSGQE